MTSHLLAAAATVGLLGAGFASAGETRAFSAMTAYGAAASGAGAGIGASDACRVDVDRNGAAGSARVTRSVLNNGECVCTVVTGPKGGNGSAENIVDALLRDRTCDGAPLPAGASNGAAAAASGGGSGSVVAVVVGVGAAAGLAVGLSNKSKG